MCPDCHFGGRSRKRKQFSHIGRVISFRSFPLSTSNLHSLSECHITSDTPFFRTIYGCSGFTAVEGMPDLDLPREACLGGVPRGACLDFVLFSVRAIQSVGLVCNFFKIPTFRVPFMRRIHGFCSRAYRTSIIVIDVIPTMVSLTNDVEFLECYLFQRRFSALC